LTTALQLDESSPGNSCKYPLKPYIIINSRICGQLLCCW